MLGQHFGKFSASYNLCARISRLRGYIFNSSGPENQGCPKKLSVSSWLLDYELLASLVRGWESADYHGTKVLQSDKTWRWLQPKRQRTYGDVIVSFLETTQDRHFSYNKHELSTRSSRYYHIVGMPSQPSSRLPPGLTNGSSDDPPHPSAQRCRQCISTTQLRPLLE